MASDIKWTFPKNDGGRETGFHDAGVETFKGNFDRYLAREVIQNSLDARVDPKKPVRVVLKLRQIKRADIPDVENLRRAFARCKDYWKKTDSRGTAFFVNAESLAKGKEIVALQLSDYNTSGVIGNDTDREKNWYSLIRCAGSSPKGGGEGGSFGIGKNAPFAASEMRTVLYSTHTTDGGRAFQGVALLASHKLPGGATAQPTGFLGGPGGASIRNKATIPLPFRRDDQGTDIFILEFPAGPSWQDDLVYSVLDNFWLAIHLGDLVVQVGHLIVDADNLPKLLEEFSGKDNFTAHLYFEAFTNPRIAEIKKKLPTLGDCEVYLLAGPADTMPKNVAMIRRTGMKIYEKAFRSIVPFCGVFICRNEKGNALLRDMEPPGHDKWDPDLPEKGAHRATQAEFVEFIRSCIKQLWPADEGKSLSVPGLSKYLPDDEETLDEPLDNSVPEQQKGESLEREVTPAKIETRKVEPRKELQPDSVRQDEGDEDTGFDGTVNGGGGGGGGGGDKDGGSTGGDAGGSGGKPAVPISYRTFAADAGGQVYRVRIRPEGPSKSQALNAQIWTVGDDSKVPAEIQSAKNLDGTTVPVKGGGIIGPMKFPKDGSLVLEISLREPIRVAMEVIAHEA